MTYGAIAGPAGTIFRVRAPEAQSVTLCLFERDHEVRREMRREGTDWVAEAPAPPGTLYGYRAAGSFDPAQGRWFDASKLLVDPYATELDRRFAYTPSLHAFGTDTGPMVHRRSSRTAG